MPYSGPGDESLPDNVKELSERKRSQWVEVWNSAFKHCMADDGETDACESSAFRQANGVVMKANVLRFAANRTAGTRTELLGGVEYLVAPGVFVKPGVLNGELLTADEIAAHFAAWNGRPVVLAHPTSPDGAHVSANDPALLPKVQAGQLFNVSLGDDGGLRGELWVDPLKAALLGEDGKELVRRLKVGKPVEVSTAYWRDLDPEPGELDGVPYYGVASNLRPDHLAVLLHEVGACSWQDGCGAPRVNQEDQEVDMDVDVLIANGVLACAKCGDELAANFTGSPRNPYGTHASKGYPGGRDAWKQAWRIHLSKVGGGSATGAASGPLRGTQRRIAMIAAGMKPACAIPTEVTSKRGGGKSPLSGEYKETPGDYGMSRWKQPSDDDLTQDDIQFTCQDLKDLKTIVMEEINRRIADREKEEGQGRNALQSALRAIAGALGLADNAESYDERSRRVRQAWDKEHAGPDGRMAGGGPWVKEVFADTVIVEAEEGLLAYPYAEDEKGDIRFGQPVRVEVVYKPIQEANFMSQRKKILEDGRLGLNQEQLEALPDEVVETLAGSLEALVPAPEPETEEAGTPDAGTETEITPQANAAGTPDEVGALKAEMESLKANIADLAARMQTGDAERQAAETVRKAELVGALAANDACAFGKEQLEALDLATLEGLHRSLSPADYSGRGGGPQVAQNERDVGVRLVIPINGSKED